MKTQIVQTEAFDRRAAQYIVRRVIENPRATICFATGDTTRLIFDEIIRLKNELGVDFSQIHAVNLDEYVGVSPQSPASCCYRVRESLYDPLGLTEEQFHIPVSPDGEGELACLTFERMLERFGGVDLLLLSVGQNGHIAFNEPGTPFGLGIHIAPITDATKTAKQTLFGGRDKVPDSGVSMGVSDVMRAREILFVAKGSHKAEIVKKALYGPVTEDVPASILQLHPNTTALFDEAAAALL